MHSWKAGYVPPLHLEAGYTSVRLGSKCIELYVHGLPSWLRGKRIHLTMQETLERWAPGLITWSGIFPGNGNGNPLQHSLLVEFHGQRSLVVYSPWDCKDSDTIERLTLS